MAGLGRKEGECEVEVQERKQSPSMADDLLQDLFAKSAPLQTESAQEECVLPGIPVEKEAAVEDIADWSGAEERARLLRRQYDANLALRRDISGVLDAILSLCTVGPADSSCATKRKDSPATRRRREDRTHESNPRTSLRKQTACSTEDMLRTLQDEVVGELEHWSGRERNYKGLIKLLEKYKGVVKDLSQRDAKIEGVLRGMRECVGELGQTLSIAKKRPKSEKKSSVVKAKSKKKGAEDSCEEETIWSTIDQYFPEVTKESLACFESLNALELETTATESHLNMHSINRLSAIFKMLQYCRDTNIEVVKFQEGRITQKITAWHKIHNTENSDWCYSKSFVKTQKEDVCYPSVEELDYLLRLDLTQLPSEFAWLKHRLTPDLDPEFDSDCAMLNAEQMSLLKGNKALRKRIIRRMRTEMVLESSQVVGTAELGVLESKYLGARSSVDLGTNCLCSEAECRRKSRRVTLDSAPVVFSVTHCPDPLKPAFAVLS